MKIITSEHHGAKMHFALDLEHALPDDADYAALNERMQLFPGETNIIIQKMLKALLGLSNLDEPNIADTHHRVFVMEGEGEEMDGPGRLPRDAGVDDDEAFDGSLYADVLTEAKRFGFGHGLE